MVSLALIGLVGGLITGISPCILPVLPVIFFSGTTGTPDGTVPATPNAMCPAVSGDRRVGGELQPGHAGGSALLSLLHLPQDAIRWVALVALVAIGLGLIFPPVEATARAPVRPHPAASKSAPQAMASDSGLALGVLYRPVRRAGAGRDRRGRRHRDPSGCRSSTLTVAFADRCRGAAAGLRAGRTASRRAGQCFSASPARDSHRRRGRDRSACGGAGVQPARGAAAGDPRLHRLIAATSWTATTSSSN